MCNGNQRDLNHCPKNIGIGNIIRLKDITNEIDKKGLYTNRFGPARKYLVSFSVFKWTNDYW